jgi:hypothetical protein
MWTLNNFGLTGLKKWLKRKLNTLGLSSPCLKSEKQWKPCQSTSDIAYPASWINAARWEDVLDMTPVKPKVDRSWMFSQQGIENKARELGILGNGYDSYETLKKKCMMRMGMEID